METPERVYYMGLLVSCDSDIKLILESDEVSENPIPPQSNNYMGYTVLIFSPQQEIKRRQWLQEYVKKF